jgi:hypothetical protein
VLLFITLMRASASSWRRLAVKPPIANKFSSLHVRPGERTPDEGEKKVIII